MVVTVFVCAALGTVKAFATIARGVEKDIHLVDQVGIVGRGGDDLVVVWPCAAGNIGVTLLPAFAAIGGAVEALLFFVGLNCGVDNFRRGGRDG